MYKRYPRYPDDADYQTNSPSYYDDLARKQKLIEILANKIWEYEETLDLTLEEISERLESYIQENDNLMTDRLEQWDLNLEKFPENVELLLQEWLSDGTLDHIINETIFNWKADKTYVDSEIERLDLKDENLTVQLTQNTTQLSKLPHYVEPTESGDDHDYLQNALDNHYNVVVKKGTYYINTEKRLKPRSNQTITFEEGAIFKPLYNESGSSRLIFIQEVENVTIHNPTLIGDRDVLDTGSDGHGITISRDSKNIKVYNPSTSNFRGDGFTIYGGENIYVSNLFSDNNRRMGLTITNGKNVTIDNPICQNSNGGDPQAGIDIEPNFNTDTIENITINNPILKDNGGAGITIGLNKLKGVRHNVSITVNNAKMYGNGFNIINLKDVPVPITGSIVFNNPEVYNARRTAFLLEDYSSENTPVIEVINPKFFNWNESNYPSATWGSAMHLGGDVKIGNINFYNVRLEENREKPQAYDGVYLNSTGGYDKINFFETNFKEHRQREGVNYINNTGSDPIEIDDTFQDFGWNQKVTNIREGGSTVVILRADIPVTSFQRTYLNMGSRLVIEPRESIILGLTETPSQQIATNDKGAYMKLEKISETEYRVISMFGDWVAV